MKSNYIVNITFKIAFINSALAIRFTMTSIINKPLILKNYESNRNHNMHHPLPWVLITSKTRRLIAVDKPLVRTINDWKLQIKSSYKNVKNNRMNNGRLRIKANTISNEQTMLRNTLRFKDGQRSSEYKPSFYSVAASTLLTAQGNNNNQRQTH